MAKLILNPSTSNGAEIGLDGLARVVIGRAPHNDLVVPRRMASRDHAMIELRDGRYFVSDRESYNGTFVNQVPIREVELRHGDEIQIANYVLRFIGDFPAGEFAATLRVDAPRIADDSDATDPLLPRLDEVPCTDRPTEPGSEAGSTWTAGIAALSRPPAEPASASHDRQSAPPDAEVDARFLAPTEQEFDFDLAAIAATQLDDSLPPPASPALPLPPRAGGERRLADSASAPPREDSLLDDWRLWLVAIAFLALVIIALTRAGTDDSDQGRGVGALDGRALRVAIESEPADRPRLLWAFIGEYSESPLREDAYIELLAGGEPLASLCAQAAITSPDLFYDGGRLKAACDAR